MLPVSRKQQLVSLVRYWPWFDVAPRRAKTPPQSQESLFNTES